MVKGVKWANHKNFWMEVDLKIHENFSLCSFIDTDRCMIYSFFLCSHEVLWNEGSKAV